MTLERAAEMVKKMRDVDSIAAMELFSHFVNAFNLININEEITNFAELCEYPIARNVRLVPVVQS